MTPKGRVSRLSIFDADVDELRDHYARTLKPVRVDTLVRGSKISVEDLHFSVGDFDIWSGQCLSGMEVRFTALPDAYVVYLPRNGSMEVTSGGRTLQSQASGIIVADLGKADALRLHPGRSHIGIAFSRDVVKRELAKMLDGPAVHDLEIAAEIPMGVAAYERLGGLGQLIWNSLESDAATMLSLRSTEYLFRGAIVSLLESVPHRYATLLERPPVAAIPRQVKRAIDYMVAHLGEPLGIDDLAQQAGVSVRSLQVGFRQFTDTSPLEYLRTLRLNAARHEIMSGAAGTVAEIASRWGFTHMGRFSGLYRQAYGELPFDSLQRSRGLRY